MQCVFECAPSLPTQSKFLDFSEILESFRGWACRAKPTSAGNCAPVSLLLLEPQRDASSNRATARAQLRKHLSVVCCRLRIEHISRIKDGLGTDRQAKAGEFLSDLNTERRIVNTQAARKRIDCKNSSVWLEAQHSAYVCAGVESGVKLESSCLEERVFEHVIWP